MATVTDEDVLELVERFDIPVEDTATVEKLTRALGEKLGAAGVPYVSEAFLERFQSGLTLKYEGLPEIGVAFAAYHRPSTKDYPGGYYQPVYRDVATGRFISASVVAGRLGK
jgi:hypothetical protein